MENRTTESIPGASDPERDPAPFRPFTFGRYEIRAELGRGGMGVVYQAWQTDLERTVAIKMILAHHLSTPEFAARLQQEAKTAAQASHPNIVQVFEVGVLNQLHFIAMEFVAGENLAWLRGNGSIDVRTAVAAVAAVARGVQHLHEHGILHQDLKPSNIVVAADGRPVLMDFGLARAAGRSPPADAADERIAGTPGYIAPEILAQGNGRATPRSDVYGLGATLYEVVTGTTPFAASSPMQALVDVLEKDPPSPRVLAPKIARELEAIILRCLEREPAHRYPSAADLADDLEQWLVGEPIRATLPAGLSRVRRWVRGHAALAARLAGFVLFFLVALWSTFGAGVVPPGFLARVTLWLAMWAVASGICDALLARAAVRAAVPFAWALADVVMLTLVLREADGPASPLILVYPLLIVTAAFWSRVAVVVSLTALVLASYGVLVVDAILWRPRLQVELDHHLIFLCVVLLTGTVVGMQTRRARAVGEHFAKRLRA